MRISLFQVDAFTRQPFAGNPAAVCPLANWLDDDTLRKVAAENNLSETAYLVAGDGFYELRWFTPRCEVELCGHATLASAYVLLKMLRPELGAVRFQTRFSGPLTVRTGEIHQGAELLAMDFPALPPQPCANPPDRLLRGLRSLASPAGVLEANRNYVVAYESPDSIRRLRPDFRLLEQLHPYGVMVTAPDVEVDFVSRYFAPSYGIPEDPVTGSAHSTLAPYWAQRLKKDPLTRAPSIGQRRRSVV